MEAVPRLYMLAFDLKSSPSSADFTVPLKKYIHDFYHENPDSYDKEIKELEVLRQAMCRVTHDFTGCSILKRYFSQLNLLQNRFPMTDDGPACVPFTWTDVYSGSTVTITDIKYEQACVLYNVGALHSQLGASDSRTDAEGMKMACTHFQCAAWAFQYLRDNYPQPKGSDMSHDILTFKMNVMLAQAQECILEKSMLDNRKSSITAKVAIQIVDYYRCALGILTSEAGVKISEIVNSKMYKNWKKYIEFKMAYYMSISHFFMGNHSEEQQKMGERVAWYQSASEHLNEAIKISKAIDKESLNESLTFLVDVIGGKFNNSKKENDFVYHEKVPPVNVLPELKGASLVKGIPFNPNDPDVCGQDIFSRLVPMTAMYSSSLYSEEKAKILRSMLARVEERDEELSTYLSSLQMDKNIFNVESEEIPQDLLEKCAAMSVRPTAVSDLSNLMTELKEMSDSVGTNLKLCFDLLSEEETKEAKHQEIFGKRVPSMITVELKKERSKLEETHIKAQESNKTLQNAAETHIDNLMLLSLPLEELKTKLPSLENVQSSETSQAIQDFKKLLSKVDEMQNQRQFLSQQLRDALLNDDITQRLVGVDKPSDVDKVFQEELKKHDQTLLYIEQNLSAQDNILAALTKTNAGFADVRKSILMEKKNREVTINTLIASFEAYEDLVVKCKKGLEFYTKLKSSVAKLHDRIRSVTKVQDEERAQRAGADRLKNTVISNPTKPLHISSETPKLKDYLPHMVNQKIPPLTMQHGAAIPHAAAYPTPNEMPAKYASSYAGRSSLPDVHSFQMPNSARPVQQNVLPASHSVPVQDSSHFAAPTALNSNQYNIPQTSTHNGGKNSENLKSTAIPDSSYALNTVRHHNQVQAPYSNNLPSTKQLSNNPVPSFQNQASFPTNGYTNMAISNVYPTQPNNAMQHQNVPSIPAQATNVNPSGTLETYSSGTCISHPGIATNNYYPHSSTMTNYNVSSYTMQPITYTTTNVASYMTQPTTHTSTTATSSYGAQPSVPPTTNIASYSMQPSLYSTPNTVSPQVMYSSVNVAQPTVYSTSNVTLSYTVQPAVFSTANVATSFGTYPTYSGHQVYASNFQNNYNVTQSYSLPQTTYSNTPSYSINSATNVSGPYTPSVMAQQNYTLSSSVQQPHGDTGLAYSQTGSSYPNNMASFPNVQSNPYANPQATYTDKAQYSQAYNAYNVPTNYPTGSYPTSQTVPAVQHYANVTQNNQNVNSVLESAPVLSQAPLKPQTIEPKTVPSQGKKASNCDIAKDSTKVKESTANSSKHKHKTPYFDPSSMNEITPIATAKSQVTSAEEKDTKTQAQVLQDLSLMKIKPASIKDPLSDPSVQLKFIAEVEKFEKLVEGLTKKSLNGTTPLDQKWKELMDTQEKESRKMSISIARCYPLKNRVPDIMPYDGNRVKMISSKDDYINASFMKDLLPDGPPFVITQAPLASTFCDFWLMVWEQQVETLVCLVPQMELKNGCYWPKERGIPVVHGIFELILQSQKEKNGIVERIISINNTKNKSSRVVVHLHFTMWYASKFPVVSELLSFISVVLSFYSQQRSLVRPIVAHCSSGVGRSGMFCLITTLVSEINMGHGPRDVSSVAARMCTQRKFIIQEKEQLKYCYDAILSYAQNCLEKKGLLSRKQSFDEKPVQPQAENGLAKLQLSMASITSFADVSLSSQLSTLDEKSTSNGKLAEDTESVVSDKSSSNGDHVKESDAESAVSYNSSPEKTISLTDTNEISNVSSILDPKHFTLDTQTVPLKRRISKDDFVQATGVLSRSSIDSSDPLSSLDPLWSLKKPSS